MLKRLTDWFQTRIEDTDSTKEHQVELATAVLLYEIMRADDSFNEQEQAVYHNCLREHFDLAQAELDTLYELTATTAGEAADFVQFTRVINDNCDMAEKLAVMLSLWRIAYADFHLDPHEEHLIRRIADLLYIPHSQFIRSKLNAQEAD